MTLKTIVWLLFVSLLITSGVQFMLGNKLNAIYYIAFSIVVYLNYKEFKNFEQ